MSFINKYSWKCLLGPQAKEMVDHGGIYTWKVGKKNHLAASRQLDLTDIQLINQFTPFNFNYMWESNIEFLKQHFRLQKTKDKSVIVCLENFDLSGGEFKKTRQAHNKCKKMNLSVEDNYRKIEDVHLMIEDWSNNYTEKYFRDFSGKNFYFYKNNFHQECLNIFIYREDELLAFGTLSPEENGKSSYILGKALYKKIPGLSEFADIELYYKGIRSGIKSVNMGRAPKNLLQFKMKYPGASVENTYEGKVEK
jgi:hypothetical protein